MSHRSHSLGAMGADDLLHGLDERQRTAVTSTAGPLAIIAAAGSGKTTVLTRRIAHRVATGSADPRHVIALTFTREAAAQLRRRVRALDVREPIEAGTFHSVALRLLRDRALAANQQAPQVANDRHRLVAEAIRTVGSRVTPSGLAADLDWARARLVAPADYELATRRSRRKSSTPPSQFVQLVEAYELAKRRRGVMDFDDLLIRTLDAIRDDPTFAEIVRWRFRHLFVDEAQDLNPLQHALLEAWRDGRPDLCLVGDPRQAIYGWNGADPTTLLDVERSYPGVTIVRLTSNYRCTPQVVRAGAAALGSAPGADDDTTSARPDGTAVRIALFDRAEAEATAVAKAVRRIGATRPWREIAVLARTNDQLVALEGALTRHGVPVGRAAGRSPLERALREALGCRNRELLASWVERVFADDDADPVRARVADEADRFLASTEPGGLRAWIEARNPFDDLDTDDEGSVALVTFHAAKGREWSYVFVTGVEEGLVPHASAITAPQRSEEARLLYVALTRAGDELVVSASNHRNGIATAPSAWLEGVRATAAIDAPVPPPPRANARTTPADPLGPYRQWRAEAARRARVPDEAICSDHVLRSLAADPPASTDELARRLGITATAAARLHELPVPAATEAPRARGY